MKIEMEKCKLLYRKTNKKSYNSPESDCKAKLRIQPAMILRGRLRGGLPGPGPSFMGLRF